MLSVFAQAEIPDIQWLPLIPHLVMAGAAVVLLTIVSLAGSRLPGWFASVFTMAAGLGVLATAIPVWIRVSQWGPHSAVADSIGVDQFSVFIIVVLACTVILTALVADGFLHRESLDGPAFYVLLMLSAAGGITMASANNLIVLFLGLEILSLAVYVLVAMHLRRAESQEAGIKYFVLGAFASAFLLYGIALVYGATGSLNLIEIEGILQNSDLSDNGLLLAGMGMLLVGFGFKVAAVPFHAWTPDVYQGAPSPVVSYMAAGVKAAGFAAMLRVFFGGFGGLADDWQPVVFGLAIASLAVGSMLAIVQTDVKRILAYSSISHAGFILVGVQAATDDGVASVLFYLAAYAAMAIGSFAVITLVSGPGDEGTGLDSLRGLAARHPLLAAAFTVLLLSQAGIPFTVGFWAKFEVITAAVDARSFWLAVIAMLAAVVAAFLYLRIVVAMFLDAPDPDAPRLRIPRGPALAITIVVLFTLAFGIYPEPILDLADHAQLTLQHFSAR
ncbi:MAG: NADH-quinone oxidoreductase subunit N [Acidimicrobiia bacterium]|nr:NADH-quinone oxidoreductase subunit N [Acidimicrobiia bacterium]MYG71729.1 NADH-quinone oxidoreductase subunit N [Acidimicrobiia bacterium]